VKYTRPLKPIIDMLRAPIPVLSDLARLTGQSIGTLRQILENSGARLALIDALTDAIDFAERASATVAENTWVGLGVKDGANNSDGKFITKPKDKRTGSCGKTVDGVKQAKDCKTQTRRGGTKTKTSVKQTQPCPATGCTGKEMTRTMTSTVNKPKLVGTGVAFPFLNDSGQVFGMLLGESDAVLVRFDAGTLGASGGLGMSFGPFMAGPVPIDISIGVQLSINARFAMGYDTRGILNTLRQEPDAFNPDALLDGIFIDDNDLFGTDVPEIRVAVTATLGASLSVSVFKVGLEGGVTIGIDFNLHDSDGDGRIRIEEIKAYGDNPQCLFDIRGTLGFFLQFFVEVDLKLWSKRWNVTLFELRPPVTLFEVECERPEPALARGDRRGEAGATDGPRAPSQGAGVRDREGEGEVPAPAAASAQRKALGVGGGLRPVPRVRGPGRRDPGQR
jgi:hypothetical protein